MATIEILSKQLETDEDGNLKNLADWDKEIAVELAKQKGLTS